MNKDSTFMRVLQNPNGAAGLTIVLLIVLMAIFAGVISPFDPVVQARGKELAVPGVPFWLGTDQYGRDILSRLIHGSRISLMVAIIAVGAGGSIGILTGLVTGYRGGWLDTLVMRIFDVIMAYPAIILGITIVAVIGTGSLNVAYALAIVYIPQFARVVRASVISQKEREYVTCAIAIGCKDRRIIFKHIFPNSIGPILVQTSLSFGAAVLAEASLSFLGLGTQPPSPSWGTMISEGRTYLRQAWWYPVFPGLALALFSTGLNYFSDALRDALDPGRRNLV
jgi:peptide/nickel transport system permease protein